MPSQQAMRCVVAYQVGDGPAHGSYVAGAGLRDEVHEPVPLVAVVAAHRRDHRTHPIDRHGIRRGVNQKDENHYRGKRGTANGGGWRITAAALQEWGSKKFFEALISKPPPFVFPSHLFKKFQGPAVVEINI